MFSPMIFNTTATISSANDTTSRNVRFCASSAPPDPIMYALIEALASNRPGK